MRAKDGERRRKSVQGKTIERDNNGNAIHSYGPHVDMTLHKPDESEREITIKLLQALHAPHDLRSLIRDITVLLQNWSGCEAVGIRLMEADDYPYFVTRGFPPRFVKAERFLCAVDQKGERMRDSTGNPVLECMCGNVMCGRFDPSLPFFTENGSFWTNSTTDLLASTTEEDRQARTRNRCNSEGYESVALIPLSFGSQRLGLLQLNDHRWGLFDEEKIGLFEHLASILAVGLSQRITALELRKSEERFRNTFEQAAVGIAHAVPGGRFVRVNQRFCDMVGYSREELVQKTFQEITHPDDIQFDLLQVRRLLEGKLQNFSMEKRYFHKDGTTLWVNLTVSLVRDLSGEPDYFIGIIENIDDRKNAEEALRKSEKKFRSLFNNAEVGMFRTRIDGSEMLDMNQSFLEIFGRTREEMLGTPSATYWADPLERQDMICRLKAKGHVTNFECGMLNKKGERRQCLTSLKSYREEGFLEGSIIDITERKAIEQTLRESEEKYRILLENAGEAICIVQDERLKFANPETEKISGYSSDELEHMPAYDLIHPEDRAMVVETHMKRLHGGVVPSRYTFRIIRKSGETRWVALNAIRIDWEGKGASLNLLTDVTDRQAAEEEKERLQAQLLQAQKMESIGRLAGGIAHDFNNMLGIIVGQAELAMLDTPPENPLNQNLREMVKAARRSAATVRQLLGFARKQTVSPKVLGLNETISGMIEMLSRLIGEDINLTWLPGKQVGRVRMDPSQLNQILVNLVVNSRDAIDGAGRVTIESANTILDENYPRTHTPINPREYILLTVTDTGSGMNKEVREHLFEPFFTTKEVGQGTGLGLATVYGLVKQNDGFIDVYSEPGKGTTFKIYFPRVEGETTADQGKIKERKAQLGSETILLAEDEGLLLKIARGMLERQGYTVLAGQTPGEALALAGSHSGEIHLLVTDVIMPEMNGLELMEKLHTRFPNMKVLFMSGYTADIVTHHGILNKGLHFIEKPFSSVALAGKVREVLDEG